VTEKLPITALVLTKNEERVIGRTCERLADFGQILVVDSHSVDDTVKIATAAGADVVDFEWNGQYPKKKQWALESDAIRYDWVLYIDADESPSEGLIDELRRLMPQLQRRTNAAYEIPVAYFFLGQELHHGYRVSKRALVDRTRCRFPVVDDLGVANMWEVEGHYQPVADGRVGQLTSRLEHDDIDPLFDYFARHNRYSDWEAHLRCNADAGAQVAQNRSRLGQLFDRVPAKPVVFFLYAYVFRRGFLDGFAGFHYAVANAFYYWQTMLKTRELRNGR
jgi:glycosyltransferase involved in cell wall biosynthesis